MPRVGVGVDVHGFASDPERIVYRAFGLERTRWRTFLRPRVLLGYLAAMLRGYAPVVPYRGEDVLQLGGNVVRDGSTKVLYLALLVGVALAWWVARVGPELARRTVRIGIVCLVLSIVLDTVFHEVNKPLRLWLRRGDAGHEAFTLVKQGLELGGWVLVAAGLYAVAAARWRSSEAPLVKTPNTASSAMRPPRLMQSRSSRKRWS